MVFKKGCSFAVPFQKENGVKSSFRIQAKIFLKINLQDSKRVTTFATALR